MAFEKYSRKLQHEQVHREVKGISKGDIIMHTFTFTGLPFLFLDPVKDMKVSHDNVCSTLELGRHLPIFVSVY